MNPPHHLLGQLADVDLRLLRVFRQVVECGGMASAELELNISMSTISRHIKDLEERVGLTVCRRGRSGFALTPEGQQLYDATLRLLAATEAFRSNVHDLHRRLGGDLHVALFEKTVSNPAVRISQAVAALRRDAPDVSLHLHVGGLSTIERGVMDGQYHLGIIPEHRRSESFDYDELFDERMLLYAGAGHPWHAAGPTTPGWNDLHDQALAALGYQSPNMDLMHRHRLRREATASDQEGIATLVLSGAFLGFLPDHYAQPLVAQGRLRAVHPEVLAYDCRFVCISRRTPALVRVAQAFREQLVRAHRGGVAAGPSPGAGAWRSETIRPS